LKIEKEDIRKGYIPQAICVSNLPLSSLPSKNDSIKLEDPEASILVIDSNPPNMPLMVATNPVADKKKKRKIHV